MENITEGQIQGAAKEAVQIAALILAMLSNEDSRVHVHVIGGDGL